MSSAPTSTEIIKYNTLLSKAQHYYKVIIPYLKPENVVVAGIIGSGVASLAWFLSKIIAYLQKKIAMLVFTTSTINSSTNPLGYEQMTGLLKSLCRDDSEIATIKGDDGNKQESAADEILTHDTNETLLRLRSGMPPVAIRFVPGIFSASFFYVASKDLSKRKNFLNHIVYVWRDGDPSLFIQIVPDSLRSAISWAWQNAGPETVLIKIFGSLNYQKMIRALTGSEDAASFSQNFSTSKSSASPSLHVTTWSSMSYLHAYFQDEASSFHQMRMTKSLIVNDLMKGMKVQGSPRPMSTIAVDPSSDINMLKQDVKSFFNDPKVFTKLTDNHRPYQKLFILHGPPGNGKSSILQALAIEYGISYYIMNIGSDKSLTLDSIKHKLAPTLSGNCLVIFEDAESALPKSSSGGMMIREDGEEEGNNVGGGGGTSNKPKFSVEEFLGLFDGSVDSGKPNGRLVFFTTNTPDALHHKVAALSNDQYEFCNPGKQVMEDYWQNFFQDQPKSTVKKTWNVFSANYNSIWNLGEKEDHSTYKVHTKQNVVSKVQRKLVLDEERGKKKQSMTYGLNGQHVFCATHVYVLSIENGMNCFVPSPSDWTPGFFWKVNVFFAGSLLSEEFVLCESLDIGSTTLYITRVPISSDLDTKDSERFCNDDIVNIEIVEHRQHSMAMLQKYCIRFRNNPEDACMAKHIEQLGEKTPAGNTSEKVEKQGGKKENEINLRVQSTAIAARMKATSSEVATRMRNIDVDASRRHDDPAGTSPRKQARILIDSIEQKIAVQYKNESKAFLIQKTQQTLRTELQKLNAKYIISPYSTKKINLTVTVALTSSIVLFGLLQKKFMGIPIKKWYLLSAVAFFVGPSLFEEYRRKSYAEFRVACTSKVGRALVSYLDQRVKNISGYNVQAAINVNRIKGKAEEKMMDYALSTLSKEEQNASKKLYKIRMGAKEAPLIPKLANDWHAIEATLSRDGSNDDSKHDTVTVYHQINEGISNDGGASSVKSADEIMRRRQIQMDSYRYGGERDSSTSQQDNRLEDRRTVSLGPMTISIKR